MFSSFLRLLVDFASVFRTVFLSFWAAFILPAGVLLSIAYGGWLYFGPFVVANVLVAYKINNARKTQQLEAFDDKKFVSSERALESYRENYWRVRESEEKPGDF